MARVPKRKNGWLQRLGLTGLFLCFCGVLSWALVQGLAAEARTWEMVMAERERLSRELAVERQRNQELRRLLDEAGTPEGIEQAARSTLGYVRPGEHVYLRSSAEQP